MAADDDLEPRVSALDDQVRDLKGRVQGSEHDAAAARMLAGAADRDVSEFQSELRDFRSDMTEVRNDITELRTDMTEVRNDITELRTDMTEVRNDITELRTDVNVLQGDVGELRTDVTGLKGEMRDFRNATTASFNAQRQDFIDLRQDFVRLTDHVDQGFTEMRGKFDATAAGLQQITQMLQTALSDPPQ